MPEFQQKSDTVAAGLRTVQFHDPERACQNFALVQRRVPEELAAVIPHLLADLPDPDAALNFFERWSESAGAELVRLLDQHRSLAHYALAVFGYSQFLGETLLRNPDIFQLLLRERSLDRAHSHEEFREAFGRFRSRSFESDIALLLARFKRREYIRIMLRDVLGVASLAETTAEISALTDVLIQEAVRECMAELHRRYGQPQHRDREGRLVPTPFSVLGLGKLGGNELNYSSDIDLFYIYGEGTGVESSPVTNREYFVRLGQQITSVLSRATPEGFVFRIDLRLRPQGREGETAISLGHAVQYYSENAQDWEKQAMIKARPVAADEALARQFIRKLQEQIYTEQVNFAAIETALASIERIREKRANTREGSIDVKLDRGGIRDIEFLVQCLQRVYGGKERWLRSGATLFSLQKLHDKRHISGSDFNQLTTAYELFRCIEHRLQLRRGQQTHRIPIDQYELEILARSLGRSSAKACGARELVNLVRERMGEVSAIYDRIIHLQQQRGEQQVAESFQLRTADVEFGRVPSDQQVLQRLSLDSGTLFEIASRKDLDPHTRRNLFKFLSSSFTSAERYAAILAAPEAVERALELFRTSEFLTDILARHPEDVSSLNQFRSSSTRNHTQALFPTDDRIRAAHSDALDDYLASQAVARSEKMSLLRRRFRYREFFCGARDVIESRPVFASLADMTAAAEEAIAGAWSIAGRPSDLAILALGRLGTSEFDCLSDVDLVFVRSNDADPASATRVAEEVVQALSAYTNEGTVVAVDLRLRPHGGEGEIVVTIDSLASYFRHEAATWEALTHTKLRRITGSESIAMNAISSARELFDRVASTPSFSAEVREMRAKLEKSEPGLKTSPGGSYDIDFLTSYLLIKNGIHAAEGTLADRLKLLGRAGLISTPEIEVLLDALHLFRTADHAIRLVTGRVAKTLPASDFAHKLVEEVTSRTLSRPLNDTLDAALESARVRVRQMFDRLLA